VEDLANSPVVEQRGERRELFRSGEADGVEERDLPSGRDLDQSETRAEGTLEDELGVETDGVRAAGALDQVGEPVRTIDPGRGDERRDQKLFFWIFACSSLTFISAAEPKYA
jgi:hypothetical protein